LRNTVSNVSDIPTPVFTQTIRGINTCFICSYEIILVFFSFIFFPKNSMNKDHIAATSGGMTADMTGGNEPTVAGVTIRFSVSVVKRPPLL
jgi:hypothetical protein